MTTVRNPIQKALREKKRLWNKACNQLVSETIASKQALNGNKNKLNISPSRLTEPLPGEISRHLDHLSTEFLALVRGAEEIIREQNEYSQDLNSADDGLVVEASNPLTRFWARNVRYFRNKNKYYLTALMKNSLELKKNLDKLQDEILKNDPKSIPLAVTIANKIGAADINTIQEQFINMAESNNMIPSSGTATEENDDTDQIEFDKIKKFYDSILNSDKKRLLVKLNKELQKLEFYCSIFVSEKAPDSAGTIKELLENISLVKKSKEIMSFDVAPDAETLKELDEELTKAFEAYEQLKMFFLENYQIDIDPVTKLISAINKDNTLKNRAAKEADKTDSAEEKRLKNIKEKALAEYDDYLNNQINTGLKDMNSYEQNKAKLLRKKQEEQEKQERSESEKASKEQVRHDRELDKEILRGLKDMNDYDQYKAKLDKKQQERLELLEFASIRRIQNKVNILEDNVKLGIISFLNNEFDNLKKLYSIVLFNDTEENNKKVSDLLDSISAAKDIYKILIEEKDLQINVKKRIIVEQTISDVLESYEELLSFTSSHLNIKQKGLLTELAALAGKKSKENGKLKKSTIEKMNFLKEIFVTLDVSTEFLFKDDSIAARKLVEDIKLGGIIASNSLTKKTLTPDDYSVMSSQIENGYEAFFELKKKIIQKFNVNINTHSDLKNLIKSVREKNELVTKEAGVGRWVNRKLMDLNPFKERNSYEMKSRCLNAISEALKTNENLLNGLENSAMSLDGILELISKLSLSLIPVYEELYNLSKFNNLGPYREEQIKLDKRDKKTESKFSKIDSYSMNELNNAKRKALKFSTVKLQVKNESAQNKK